MKKKPQTVSKRKKSGRSLVSHSVRAPLQGYALITSALRLMESGRLQEALEAINRASPRLGEPALLTKVIILLNLKQYEDAIVVCDELIQQNAEHADAYFRKAQALAYLHRLQEALSAACSATQYDLSHLDAWEMQGDLLSGNESWEQALHAYAQALLCCEDDPDPLLVTKQGQVLGQMGRHEEALTAFEHVLRLQPEHPYAYMNRGDGLNAIKRYEEALLSYQYAIDLDPCSPLVPFLLFKKGGVLRSLGRSEEALEAFEEASRYEEPQALADEKEERVYYDEVAFGQIDSRSLPAYGKGLALFDLRRYEEALAAYQAALLWSPGASTILQEVERVQKALDGEDGLAPETPSLPLIPAEIQFSEPGCSQSKSVPLSFTQRLRYGFGVLAALCVLVVAILTLAGVKIDHMQPVLLIVSTSFHLPLVVAAALFYPVACWLGWTSSPQSPSFPWSEKPSAKDIPVWLYAALRGSVCGYFYLGATLIFSEWLSLNGFPLPLDDVDTALALGRALLGPLHICSAIALAVVLSILRSRRSGGTFQRKG